MRVMRFVALLLLSFATAAYADNEPTADWAPNPDPSSPEGVDNPGAVATPDGTPELTITGASIGVVATPTGGVVDSFSVANVACSVQQLSGPAGALSLTSGTLFPMAKLADTPPTWTPAVTVTVACTHGASPVTGLLVCNQTPKFSATGRFIKTWWDISCPSVNPPEWSSTPNNGSAINLSTPAGSSTTGTVTVNNTGTSDLTVNPNGLSGVLSVSGAGTTATIAAGGNQSFTITCNPASASTTNQTLSFDTNDADEDPVTFPVQCVGTSVAAPEYVSTPADGATISITSNVGNPSTSVLNIANSGNATLTGTLSGLSGVLGISSGALNLAGGANQNYTITCTPAAATTVVQTLTVTSNDADEGTNTYTVQCTGSNAPAPEFSSNPVGGSTIAITTNVGASATDTVVVSNTGTATLNVTATIGGSPVFAVAPTGAQTVAAGGNRTFTITCAPTVVGTQTQTLTLATNDSDEGTVTYSVNCTGRAPEFSSVPPAPGPIQLTGTAGPTDPTATITITNTGSANLVIASATGLNGDLSLQSPPAFPATIAPGNNLVLTIRCDAGNQDTDSDVLSLDTNDADEDPVTYDVNCDIGPAGAEDYFSTPAANGTLSITTGVGSPGTATLTIQNVGGAPLSITSGTYTAGAGTTAEISASAIATGPLAAGASTTVTFTCQSAATGSFTGTYAVVHSDGPESPANYTINCTVANLAPDYGSSP
ncbi:MAG TPA: choice-of-anchor D domain-containing protein, partial [Xanthomonadales bacterium]|nr:choice-of-anchor D domain-containing protein [Xanthomonadales bacterium]